MSDLICIVDDDPSFRTAIARLLDLRGYQAAQFGSATAFLDALRGGVDPACMLLDIRLPDLSGPALQEQLANLG